ncbi:MAG: protein phosphatase 2C domain-containing protein [Saprospiraceae bacterium]|nr:protein phosphatase 2C domain-containing protein [Saprospiraceae bacterium]
MSENMNRAIIAGGTKPKPDMINQDAVVIKQLSAICEYIAVADGIGSSYKSEIASRIVCAGLFDELIGEEIETKDKIDQIDWLQKFGCLPVILNRESVKISEEGDSLNVAGALATTLICALDTDNETIISYVGNGAILHLRGNFNRIPDNHIVFKAPWNVSNLLNPHSVWENGNNALYKFISPSAKRQEYAPSVIKMTKDNELYGDIIILCTDGLYSKDQEVIGEDDDRKVWIQQENKLADLYKTIDKFLKKPETEMNNESLQNCLEGFLERAEVEDDCTLAVIISPQAVKYQKNGPK